MKKIFIGLIKFYRKYLSPLKGHATCKYFPTCSQYAIEAIEKYGVLKVVSLQYGGYLDAILFQKEDMIQFHKGENYVSN